MNVSKINQSPIAKEMYQLKLRQYSNILTGNAKEAKKYSQSFAKKWAEAVGQSLYYSKMTGKKPAIALILTSLTDYRYLKRIERLDNDIKVFLIKAY